MIPANSSAIRAVGYNPITKTLAVLFRTSNTIYEHPGVPYALYAGLMRSPSMGAYYNRFIRGKYR